MATEPTEVPVAEQDPGTGTPDTAATEPSEDTPQPEQQVDWETRYQEAQQLIARQGHELGLYRAGQAPEDDGAEGEPDEGYEPQTPQGEDPYVSRLEGESWSLAESLYGTEAVVAYTAANRILARAETPADFLAAFEAYYEVRSGGGTPADAVAAAAPAAGRTRADAVQPRVDANRSDAGPDPSEVAKLEEARKQGNLAAFTGAATRLLGFGGKEQPTR
jgi:hypothetical protein